MSFFFLFLVKISFFKNFELLFSYSFRKNPKPKNASCYRTRLSYLIRKIAQIKQWRGSRSELTGKEDQIYSFNWHKYAIQEKEGETMNFWFSCFFFFSVVEKFDVIIMSKFRSTKTSNSISNIRTFKSKNKPLNWDGIT